MRSESQHQEFKLRRGLLGKPRPWLETIANVRIHGQTHKTPLELFEQEKLRLKPRPLTAKEGRYFHDYRTSNMGVDYEYVELKMPVELAKVEAWVNLYAGRAANVRGTVVIFYAGKSYYGEFKIAATSGNAGKDSQ